MQFAGTTLGRKSIRLPNANTTTPLATIVFLVGTANASPQVRDATVTQNFVREISFCKLELYNGFINGTSDGKMEARVYAWAIATASGL
jgi:hypothetical protein